MRIHPVVVAAISAFFSLGAMTACSREDTSLREGLESLPRQTQPEIVEDVPPPAPEVAITDTFATGLDTASWLTPSVPNDAQPWVIDSPTRSALGEWTAGIVEGAGNSPGSAVLTSVRAARQADFDRIVIEFDRGEISGYHVEYVDRPVRQCGSGEPTDVEGDGWLLVRLNPAQAHDDNGRPTVSTRDIRPTLPNVAQLRLICDFEGYVEWVIGVRSPNPYRVLELTNPARLVIDINHQR